MVPNVYYLEKVDEASGTDIQFCFLANSADDAIKYLYQEYCEHPRSLLLYRDYVLCEHCFSSAKFEIIMSVEDLCKMFTRWNFEIADFCKRLESGAKEGVK